MDFEDILDRVFDPYFICCANFTAFGLIFLYGIGGFNPALTYSGIGFFIAGASIGALLIADRWVSGKEIIEEKYIIKGEVNGVPTSQNKIYTKIEM